MICVLCGKKYKREVTDAHLKSHKVSREELDAKAVGLSESEWVFYWENPGLRKLFPNPTETERADQRKTFKQWVEQPKIQEKYPELKND